METKTLPKAGNPLIAFKDAKAKKDAEGILSALEDIAREYLNDLDPYVNGDERSNDLMDCGYADGEWDTWIRVLDLLEANHSYETVTI